MTPGGTHRTIGTTRPEPGEPDTLPDDLAETTPDGQEADEVETAELISEEELLEESGPASGELSEEDDDNPFQESDEALPDDVEERAISRNLSRQGGRFDES